MGIELCLTEHITEIEAGKEIRIPLEARYIRRRSGKVLFYRDKPQTSKDNGYIAIESGADLIIFPEFRAHSYHINYGLVKFIKKNLNQP